MKIIYFDGICGLCNGFVDLILKIDQTEKIMFSALQSTHAEKNISKEFLKDLSTIVYQNENQFSVKSSAVSKILIDIGGAWKVLGLFISIIPTTGADFFYDLIANNRYVLFGKKESCRLPSPKEKKRFMI